MNSLTAVLYKKLCSLAQKSSNCLKFVLYKNFLHLFSPHNPLQLLNGCLFTRKQRKAMADRRAWLFWLDEIVICHVLVMQ